MPHRMILSFGGGGHTTDVATEEELLDFANQVRAAAGADLLEALLPGRISRANSCLVATNLNFKCSVETYRPRQRAAAGAIIERWRSGAWKWVMYPYSPQVAFELSQKLDLELVATPNKFGGGVSQGVLLPEPIGNAARAFDMHAAFTNLQIEN